MRRSWHFVFAAGLITVAFGLAHGEAQPAVAAAAADAFQIEVNGRVRGANEAGWPIVLGRPNTLTLGVREPPPARPLRATLTRIQPDGRERRSVAEVAVSQPRATFDLGLFAVPAAFEFEAGVVYRRTTRFRLELADPAEQSAPRVLEFHQTIDPQSEQEILAPGAPERVVHFGGLPRGSRPLDPPVELSLAREVLSDPDDVRVRYKLRTSEGLTLVPARLQVRAEGAGKLLFDEPLTVQSQEAEVKLAVNGWPTGRYRIEVVPQVDGSDDREGPVIIYRRAPSNGRGVRLSPLAPWEFERDAHRPEIVIDDFRAAVARWADGLPKDADWELTDAGGGQVRLITPAGQWQAAPVVLRPGLRGMYAVFATTEKHHAYVRVGRAGIVRGVLEEPAFVEAADLTGDEIAIYAADAPGSGLRQLRFVPVTAASVERVRALTSRPPVPLRAVADWATYFIPPPSHHSAGGRLGADQLDAILHGQADIGFSSIGWTAGRSWVEYHSKLPNTTRFPAVPLEKIAPEHQRTYAGRAFMVNQLDPLAHVLGRRAQRGLEILPMLAMQRHYGAEAYGGIFRSAWMGAHPEWWRWSKNARRASDSATCYYFPEVRAERIDILCELAERSPDGLVVDWCRQVPIALYHPQMVAAYREKTGVDPLKIDASHETEYRAWIGWRANFVTETLRELRTRLEPIRRSTGRRIPVAVRVPSKGFFYNLAQGLDVETWCRERLVDQIQLDPLEDCAWRGEPHDVRPYLDLGKRHGVPIFGGINGNTFWNYPALLRRAAGLIEAGVAGIEFYESTNFAPAAPDRWLVPLLGDAVRARAFLGDSNLEACFPIHARNACAGYDNHSFRGNWTVFGFGSNSL